MLKRLAPRLKDPPIVEVVCGFQFSPISGVDPILVGKYWAQRAPTFPSKQIQPPVTDRQGLALIEGIGPLRCWLVSEDDQYVLQIQPDRFYFNWRKRKAAYPHFNDYGENEGVLSGSLREFAIFAEFCRAELGHAPNPARVDLVKIDLLVQQQHWTDFRDLAKLLPVVKHIGQVTKSTDPTIHMKVFEVRETHEVHFQIASAHAGVDLTSAVQMETRAAGDVGPLGLRDKFLALNDAVNEIFFEMLDPNEWKRFGGRCYDSQRNFTGDVARRLVRLCRAG
jgi:hypothetical protein